MIHSSWCDEPPESQCTHASIIIIQKYGPCTITNSSDQSIIGSLRQHIRPCCYCEWRHPKEAIRRAPCDAPLVAVVAREALRAARARCLVALAWCVAFSIPRLLVCLFGLVLAELLELWQELSPRRLGALAILELQRDKVDDNRLEVRKYSTQQFREPLLQCDEHSVRERSGRASRIVTIRG